MASAPRKNAEKTPRQMPEGKRFQPGNPGRPKGARNKLNEDFIQALAEDFKDHGVAAIKSMREDKPNEYVKVVASLLPKHVEVKDGTLDEAERDELAALLDAVRAARAIREANSESVVH
jgi:hypothetical protein